MPNNIEDYVHRIGRTGRIGKKGVAISFVNDKNKPIFKDLYSLLCECRQEIPAWFEELYSEIVIRRPKAKKVYRNFN
jgi:ATP-dependent RNA helicase DDX3X